MRAQCILLLLMATVLVKAENSSRGTNDVPLPHIEESLVQAMAEAERILEENFLSRAEISIKYHGTSDIPLRDISLEVDSLAIVHLTDLKLRSSPFHMTGVTPNLRLMNIDLHANISSLEVTGNYSVSVEIMNHTSKALIISDKGKLNLTFEQLDIEGMLGLNLKDNTLFVHTVDLQYRPHVVVLKIHYKDDAGVPQVTEERSNIVHGSVQEPIYEDLAQRLNGLLQDELNGMLSNVTIPELMGHNPDTEVSFKTSTNNQIGNLNDFVDLILNSTKDNISETVRLPDVEKSFEKKLGFIRIRGSFKAEDGWFKNLQTIHRTADVTLHRVNDSMELNAALGLTTLEFGYSRYRAELLRVGPRGVLTATVGKNSVSFRARVRYVGSNCTVTLEDLKVRELSDIDMYLTGLAPFNWVLSKIATSVVNRAKQSIMQNIELTVAANIRARLRDLDCSNYFPQPALTAAK
ncbi:uncharacterized protein [Periplaneta americana]|uniref:uncharacterized protein n=1 Tax=Periplaneta americana TaxID=6978 RepID=UPI0037E873CE